MAYSLDIRLRVLRFIKDGGSKIAASRIFGIGRATVFLWVQQGESASAKKPGPQGSYKLDRIKLAQLIDSKPDLMLKELAEELGVGVSTVHHSLKIMGYTRKKNGTLQREAAL